MHSSIRTRMNQALVHNQPMFRADRLKALRTEKGWTQEDLAQHAEISQSAISRMERGEIKAQWSDSLPRLAQVLECTIGYLKGTSDERADESSPQADLSWRPVMSSRPNWTGVVESAKSIDPKVPEWVFDVLAQSPTLLTVDMPLTPAVVLDLAAVILRHSAPPKH